jgi:ABC-2 type transport system permease protein
MMETRKTTRPIVVALLAFLLIVVLGESVALLLEYQNSSFFQQYISQNITTVSVEILVVAVLAIGVSLMIYRKGQASKPDRGLKTDLPLKAERPPKFELQKAQTTSSLALESGSRAVESGRFTFLSDTSHLFIRSLKKLIRNPILLFFSLFQPIIFLLLFTQLFSRFSSLPGFPASSYLVFAAPGIVLQNGFSSALQSGTAVVEDLRSGFLSKMLSTPVSRTAILLGRILTDMFRVVVQSIIILFLALLLGAAPASGIPGFLLMLLTIAFFAFAWSGISLSLGLKTKNSETVFGIGAFLTFPLLFASTALTPLSFLPDWMKNVSKLNPISYTVDAIRALMLPTSPGATVFDWGSIAGTIFQAYGVIGVIGIVTMGATLYLFRKVVS